MEDIIIREIEKRNDNIAVKRLERNSYLGEFKETVIAALTIDEVNEKLIYKEIEKAIQDKECFKIIVSKKIELNKVKKYLLLAKKYNKILKKIDALSFVGDIGLIVCAKDRYLDDENYNPLIKSKLERFREKGYPDIYFEAQGQKISHFYYEIIKKDFPDLIDDYKEISFIEKMFGIKCPIFEKLGGKIK